jgi:hypothetical protein
MKPINCKNYEDVTIETQGMWNPTRKNKIDTRTNRGKWNHLKIIQKISEKYIRNHVKELQTSMRNDHCAPTAGNTNAKMRHVYRGKQHHMYHLL